MRVLDIVSHSEEQTAALARRLSASFVGRDVVVLKGSLGSGKTTFVRALAGARGIDENLVRSPSFAFLHEYRGNPPIYHFDLYRLQNPSELFELGWDEYLNRDGVVFVEWGEKATELLPERYYLIEFAILSDTERQIHIRLVQP